MKNCIRIFSAIVASFALTACNEEKSHSSVTAKSAEKTTAIATQTTQKDSNANRVTVSYTCTAKESAEPVTVQYTLENNDIVSAQVHSDAVNTAVLPRDKKAVNADTQNIYIADGYSWITDSATAQMVQTASANMLMKGDEILLKDCQNAQ